MCTTHIQSQSYRNYRTSNTHTLLPVSFCSVSIFFLLFEVKYYNYSYPFLCSFLLLSSIPNPSVFIDYSLEIIYLKLIPRYMLICTRFTLFDLSYLIWDIFYFTICLKISWSPCSRVECYSFVHIYDIFFITFLLRDI